MTVNPMEIQWPHNMPGHPDYKDPNSVTQPNTMEDFGFKVTMKPGPAPAGAGAGAGTGAVASMPIQPPAAVGMRTRTTAGGESKVTTALLVCTSNELPPSLPFLLLLRITCVLWLMLMWYLVRSTSFW